MTVSLRLKYEPQIELYNITKWNICPRDHLSICSSRTHYVGQAEFKLNGTFIKNTVSWTPRCRLIILC